MKLIPLFVLFAATTALADPQLTSWYTPNAGQYARIRISTGAIPVTTWTGQTLPVYSDVEAVMYTTNTIYLYSSGLASYTMGPWYMNAAKTVLFVNKPTNQKVNTHFTRFPVAATTHANTSLGSIGIYVNGTAVFNMLDANSYRSSTGTDVNPGDGVWNRDADFAEVYTFDPGNAHQPGNGQYHMHVNPVALRYQLSDNATYTAASDSYSEFTNTLHHSPIIGWAYDGYPIYGPYGYSVTNDANSSVRRLISGYIQRNGQYGTSNLTVTGRTTLPHWAQISQNRTSLTTAQYGPFPTNKADLAGSFAVGRYAEDNDYLGDLPPASTSGVQWDLDRYNGRYCVTPDYPQGTYAYFITINTNGTPAFPYILGRQYYGTLNGASSTNAITEIVSTNFSGGINASMAAKNITTTSGDVTLTWSSVEGGTYVISASDDMSGWSDLSPSVTSTSILTQAVEAGAALSNTNRFYKIRRSTVATYDP